MFFLNWEAHDKQIAGYSELLVFRSDIEGLLLYYYIKGY